ncbi:flagellar biosynthesis protein FlhB [Shewanella sp.]|uniref:flagellar biosynthesis protein FlhB n=1 Tax=Shewanella sp. TaxID=50422 RepID=UPI003A97EF54
MAENTSQERTEKPTERRLRESRKEGQVARSRELNTAILIIIGVAAMLWFAELFTTLFTTVMQRSMQLNHTVVFDKSMMVITLSDAMHDMMMTLLPMLTVLFIAMWVSGSLPGGAIFQSSLLAFKGNRLSPISGLAKIFGKNSLMELLKSVIKITLLLGCLVLFLQHLIGRLLDLQRQDLQLALSEGLQLLFLTLMIMSCLLLLVAAIDVPFQIKSVLDKVKMTRQEVKEERKSTDGNPQIKNRIRQIQYQFSRRRIEERVPKADVIITNPTHFAVALRYSEKDAKAPFVLAKGMDEMALRIRAIGREHNKEVLEIPMLARAIYWSTRVDQEVPAGLYAAVAYVLTYVVQLKAYKAGTGGKPAPLPELQIPKKFIKH